MQSNDLRDELKARIDRVQEEVTKLKGTRDKLEAQITQEESKLRVWREALQIEAERLGEPALPLFSKPNEPYRFAGMKLIEAVDLLRKWQPAITKKQIREMLEKGNFDFRGKRPGTAVHMTWVALDKKRKKGGQ